MSNPPGPAARPIRLQELAPVNDAGAPLFANRLDLIRGVKVRLSASVGGADISVAELFALKEGTLLPLDKATDEPVEIYLDDHLVGRGELVVVGDHFGVRVTEIGKAATSAP